MFVRLLKWRIGGIGRVHVELVLIVHMIRDIILNSNVFYSTPLRLDSEHQNERFINSARANRTALVLHSSSVYWDHSFMTIVRIHSILEDSTRSKTK